MRIFHKSPKTSDLIEQISRSDKVKVERIKDEVRVSIDGDGLVLKIYPERKTAEFIDIENEWDELKYALEEKYPKFPELEDLRKSMSERGYDIAW